MPFLLAALVLILGVTTIPPIRRLIITGPVFHFAKKFAPRISLIERQAIEAGTEGFDAGLFSGRPNWDAFREIDNVALTEEEQEFLDGPTQELCKLINDWEVRGEEREVTDEIWNFVKKHGFLSLRMSKESGGHGFSTQAKSIILGKIASRSFDASTTVAVTNSLGPDELLETYGTPEQKERYLKAFARGDEVPCFAITSPDAGSDAGSMRDVGYVTYGKFNGKKVVGLEVSWKKRYITLAPKATVVLLAFYVYDPEHILSDKENRGITLALIPANHPGVNIGRRHLPAGNAFPNGPIWGEKVFIPLNWILGGEPGIGNGWKMVMHNLAAGRGVSLPSLSNAAIKLMLLTTSAYARIRRQFYKPIGKIEGVEDPLARIVEAAYLIEAGRAVTSAMMTKDSRPVVIASIMKYQATEYARRVVNDAMDIHGGKAIIDGPSNYIQSAYQMAPVAITVEGANIITRSLMVLGQAVLRSHPYFKRELEAFENHSVREFDRLLIAHGGYFVSNLFSSLFYNLTGGITARSGKHTPKKLKQWYRALAHASKRFAFLADTMIIVYKSSLKKKQRISGRIADALSELYLLSCALKKFEDDGMAKEDYLILQMVLQNGLYRFEFAINSLIENIRSTPLRLTLRLVVGTWVHAKKPASDKLKSKIVSFVLEPSEVRNRLTQYTYIPSNIDEPVGLLEEAMRKSIEHEHVILKTERAIKAKKINRHYRVDWIKEAQEKNILSKEEANQLEKTNALVERVIAVDDFDPKSIHGITK